MNVSGDAVQQALHFYKLDLDALTVFHDELDLAPFKVKVKVGGGRLRPQRPALDRRRISAPISAASASASAIRDRGGKDLVTPHVLGNYAKAEMEPLRPAWRHRCRSGMAGRRRRRSVHERGRAQVAAGIARRLAGLLLRLNRGF